jgi:SAM-dependent methyltransferase
MSPVRSQPGSSQDEINGRFYQRPELVPIYAVVELRPPEAVAMVRYREDIQERRVLDLGCGAGRLASYLRPLTEHYVGLDTSAPMIACCRERLSGMTFVQADMRDLPFEAAAFDAVFAVFNLFDAVSHGDRLRVLAEVRRVLVPGGLLFFSAHNRNWNQAGRPPRLRFRINPFSQLRCVIEYLREQVNHRRIRRMQRVEAEYALLNDAAHGYSLLHYHISREVQERQLAEAGFRLLECLDEMGRRLGQGDPDEANSSLHYVVRSLVK